MTDVGLFSASQICATASPRDSQRGWWHVLNAALSCRLVSLGEPGSTQIVSHGLQTGCRTVSGDCGATASALEVRGTTIKSVMSSAVSNVETAFVLTCCGKYDAPWRLVSGSVLNMGGPVGSHVVWHCARAHSDWRLSVDA
jgi:hypothetical protein